MQDATTTNAAVQPPSNNGSAKPAPDFLALPISVDNFSKIRQKGLIYVDKTAFIANLVALHHPIFMARPRRFGKSLLCSTLADLFANGTENFKGLAIENQWHEPRYLVFHISFVKCPADDNEASFHRAVYSLIRSKFESPAISKYLQEANVDFAECLKTSDGDARILFAEVLTKYYENTGKEFVIIIDEYDRLISNAINKQQVFEQRIHWFSEFFSIIKGFSGDGCLRFLYITGVTRYQHTGIFSGFNGFKDFSFDDGYGALFGYTEDELRRYFGAYIEYGARLFGMSFDDYLNCLRHEYDGYCFEGTEDDEDVVVTDTAKSTEVTKVYNPWSILNSLYALSAKRVSLAKVMDRFWVGTGSESSFLVNFIGSLLRGVDKESALQQFLSFLSTDLTADFSLNTSLLSVTSSPYTANFSTATDLVTAFRVAMVQAGYYTLKQLSPSEEQALKSAGEFYCVDGTTPFFLTVPNHEVETYLHYWFWPNISTFIAHELREILADKRIEFVALLKEVFSGDPQQLLLAINELLIAIGYDNQLAFSAEVALRDLLASWLILAFVIQDAKNVYSIVQDVIEERHGSLGRSDIFIAGKLNNAVLELKLDKIDSEDSLKVKESYDKTMQEAIDQIHSKRYYDKAPRRNTLCYAVVFSQKERRVVRVAFFEHSVQDHNSKLAVAKNVVEAAPTVASIAVADSSTTSTE